MAGIEREMAAGAGRVALCVDEETCRHPEMIGLDGESLDGQGWLDVFTEGDEARQAIGPGAEGEGGFAQAWVASCGDVDPINLAATLKADNPRLAVALVAADLDGSLLSRAHNASIDEVIELAAFARRYAAAKAGAAAVGAAGTAAAGAVDADGAAGESEGADGAAAGVARAGAGAGAAGHGAGGGAAGAHAAGGAHAGGTAVVEAGLESTVSPAKPEAKVLPLAPTVLGRAHAAVAVRGRGCLVPVVSGSGGAGKSSVAVLAAHLAHGRGFRTLLLDYDLQFGDVAMMCGLEQPVRIDEAMARPELLERAAADAGRLAVLAAPDRLEKADAVVADMPAFLDELCGRFEVIVANTGGAWAEQHAVLLERSYAALFLVDQRASSIRACKHALELCARCGIAASPFEFALNRCAKGAPLTAADVSSALQGAQVYELKDGGRDVEDCLGSGSPDELLTSGNDLVASLRLVLDHVLPDQGSAAAGAIAKAGAGSGTGRGGAAAGKSGLRRRGRHAGRKRGRSAR